MIITTIFDTRTALNEAVRKRMELVACQAQTTPLAVMVPGGRTPQPLFDEIASNPFPVASQFHLAYTDERHVPHDDSASNFGQSLPMVNALRLDEKQVMCTPTTLPLKQAAAAAHDTWQNYFLAGGALSLALLGLGEDGHTCSLFTPEQVAACTPHQYAVAVQRENGPHRITATPALLAQARHVIFMVAGPEKAAVVDAMLQTENLPVAARAVANCPRVSLWYAPQA